MKYEELLEGLARGLHLAEPMTPDADGGVKFTYSGFEFRLHEERHCRMVMMWTRVGLLPANGSLEFLRELLHNNFAGYETTGGAFSIDDDGSFCLHMLGSLDAIDIKQVCEQGFPNCVAMLEDWRHLAATYDDAFSPDGSSCDLYDEPPRFPGMGFMVV